MHAGMRNPDRREALDAALAAVNAPPGNVHVVQLDVTVLSSVRAAMAEVESRNPDGVDVLLHSAGYTTVGFFEDLPADEARRLMDTILFGAMELTRAVLPAMRTKGSGRIAVVSSNAVNVPHPMFSVYAAAKWALEGWCEALAIELRPFGIAVVVVQPGAHGTSFADNLVPAMPEDSVYRPLAEVALPRLAWIGRHQRDPQRAIGEIERALTDTRPSFRYRIGPDAKIAAGLKGLVPYALRARAVKMILGSGKVTLPPVPTAQKN